MSKTSITSYSASSHAYVFTRITILISVYISQQCGTQILLYCLTMVRLMREIWKHTAKLLGRKTYIWILASLLTICYSQARVLCGNHNIGSRSHTRESCLHHFATGYHPRSPTPFPSGLLQRVVVLAIWKRVLSPASLTLSSLLPRSFSWMPSWNSSSSVCFFTQTPLLLSPELTTSPSLSVTLWVWPQSSDILTAHGPTVNPTSKCLVSH